jgi:anti-sigma regulatory factor (Ser/Thr protein kinase)
MTGGVPVSHALSPDQIPARPEPDPLPVGPPHSFLELKALPRSVPHARAHTREVLRLWKLDGLAEVAELLVSELVTNAIRASVISDQPLVRLLLMSRPDGLRISVWDSAPGRPERIQLPADSVGGRGLLLVETLSADYGCYRSAGAGKVIWCVIQPTDAAPVPPHRRTSMIGAITFTRSTHCAGPEAHDTHS